MTWPLKLNDLLPSVPGRALHKQALLACALPFAAFLSGCDAAPECDTFETRKAVLQAISDDHNNPLATYAAKNSNEAQQKASNASPDSTKPSYTLGQKIVTTSTSADKRTLQCSGAISATVGDTKASKDANFTVQQAPDGKISVSVAPFRFDPQPQG